MVSPRPGPPIRPSQPTSAPGAAEVRRWAVLFATLAFFQGLNEPNEGLPAQPTRSILRSLGHGTADIAWFSAVLSMPWLLKPLFGLISDVVPLAGTRRKGYLIASGAATSAALLGLFARPAGPGSELLGWLLIATAAVAFADVAADALMVERGRRWGLTGHYQSVQWAAMYAAGMAGGVIGGELSQRRLERYAYLVCGVGALVALGAAVLWVREPADPGGGSSRALPSWRLVLAASRSSRLMGLAAFLFLWNFNPFSHAVLHLYMTGARGFSERFFGGLLALWAASSIGACAAYGFYCRRIPMRRLAHASVGLGIASTMGYALVDDRWTAGLVTLLAGFAYMSATLIQLDLAARSCPERLAGSCFALLMAVQNLAIALAVGIGGLIYEKGSEAWGDRTAFVLLLVIASATTASCWLILPWLPRSLFDRQPRGYL